MNAEPSDTPFKTSTRKVGRRRLDRVEGDAVVADLRHLRVLRQAEANDDFMPFVIDEAIGDDVVENLVEGDIHLA